MEYETLTSELQNYELFGKERVSERNTIDEILQEGLCETCEKGKSKKASHRIKDISGITEPLQLLHMDYFDPINIMSVSKKKYALVIVDDYSKYTWVLFLHSKYEAP